MIEEIGRDRCATWHALSPATWMQYKQCKQHKKHKRNKQYTPLKTSPLQVKVDLRQLVVERAGRARGPELRYRHLYQQDARAVRVKQVGTAVRPRQRREQRGEQGRGGAREVCAKGR